MQKGFQDTSRSQLFRGFPNLNFQMNNEAYGFSGCTFWLDAAYGLNTQTDLAAVSKWVDRIRGISFEQATAGNQPRLLTANANFNNLPTVEFNDTARRMASSQFVTNGGTIAFIANYNTLNTTRNVLIGTDLANTDTIVMASTIADVNGVAVTNGTNVRISGTTESTTVKIVVLTDSFVYVNGAQEASTSFDFEDGFNQIGSSISTNANGLTGNIAEILIFNRNMESANAAILSTNINANRVNHYMLIAWGDSLESNYNQSSKKSHHN